VQILKFVVVGYFILVISIKDLKTHKIQNRILLYFLGFLIIFSVLLPNARIHPIAGVCFFVIFTVLFVASNAVHKSGGIGFGDVKLIGVLALAFFDTGVRSIEIFFVSLWLALVAHICLHLLIYRKFPHRIAMAPDIFFASGLYLYAPIALLLPQ
jgi:Flp pilus assembly protein protease CpaA